MAMAQKRRTNNNMIIFDLKNEGTREDRKRAVTQKVAASQKPSSKFEHPNRGKGGKQAMESIAGA